MDQPTQLENSPSANTPSAQSINDALRAFSALQNSLAAACASLDLFTQKMQVLTQAMETIQLLVQPSTNGLTKASASQTKMRKTSGIESFQNTSVRKHSDHLNTVSTDTISHTGSARQVNNVYQERMPSVTTQNNALDRLTASVERMNAALGQNNALFQENFRQMDQLSQTINGLKPREETWSDKVVKVTGILGGVDIARRFLKWVAPKAVKAFKGVTPAIEGAAEWTGKTAGRVYRWAAPSPGNLPKFGVAEAAGGVALGARTFFRSTLHTAIMMEACDRASDLGFIHK